MQMEMVIYEDVSLFGNILEKCHNIADNTKLLDDFTFHTFNQNNPCGFDHLSNIESIWFKDGKITEIKYKDIKC